MTRFVEVKGQDAQWHVLDLQSNPPKIICTCTGWMAPLNAEYICSALESYHEKLVSKFIKIE